MDVTVGSATISSVETKNNNSAVEIKKDNVAREEQKEVVSKSGNDAVRSMGLALISKPAKTTTKSEIAKTEPKKEDEVIKSASSNVGETPKTDEAKTETPKVKVAKTEDAKASEAPKSEPKPKSELEKFKEELEAKYVATDKKQKTKPVIDRMFTGSEQEVTERIALYKQVIESDDSISPMDFMLAQDDLKDLKARELDELVGDSDIEKLTKLSKSRHLLGKDYPVDFAVEMVDLDRTIVEYQKGLGMKEGIEAASKDTHISSQSKASSFGISSDTDVKGLASLAAQAYFGEDKLDPARLGEYKLLGGKPRMKTHPNGFSATAFQDKNGNIIIAYRGSDGVTDIKSDLEMVNGTKVPEQFEQAQEFYEEIRAEYPDAKIILTGHSLGGALSQLVAARNEDAYAVTFNAPGTKDIIDHESTMSDSGNIYNVIVDGDVISGTFAQPGVTQLIDARRDRYGNKMHPHAIGNCM